MTCNYITCVKQMNQCLNLCLQEKVANTVRRVGIWQVFSWAISYCVTDVVADNRVTTGRHVEYMCCLHDECGDSSGNMAQGKLTF